MYTLLLRLIVCIIITLNPTTLQSGPTVVAMVPQAPVQCSPETRDCIVSNSYDAWGSDRDECRVGSVAYPKTEEDLISAVAYAAKNRLKVRVVSRFSHTMPKLVCPTARDSKRSLVISTRDYDAEVEVDAEEMVATAAAGVGLRQVVEAAEEAGLSLAAAPYWEGVSVGGMISSGAHGSSWWGNGGAVHEHVVGISLVVPALPSQGYAKLVWLDDASSTHNNNNASSLFNAAKVSLGFLGVISKVKFSLQKGFKRSITYNFTTEDGIEDTFMNHAKKHEFADITWYPSRHAAVYRYDDRVPLSTPGNAHFDFLGFQPNSILVSRTIRATEKAVEEKGTSKAKCPIAATTLSVKKLVANGLKNNALIFTGYPVIGPNSKMQTSGSCLYSTRIDTACAWDPRINGLFFFETGAIFAATKFGDFLRDVKRLRDLNPDSFCGIDMYNGFLIRYVRASKAYLGQSEDSVVVDFNYYRAREGLTPRLDQDVFEEVEQMAFFKYGARPHWGKNRDLAFLGVAKKYPKFGKFVEAKRVLDPLELFSSDWLDDVLFGKGIVSERKRDGCALEGQCVCSEDRHCRPHKGYFCKRGLVYEEARVCRYTGSEI